jgi:hypothetical protein
MFINLHFCDLEWSILVIHSEWFPVFWIFICSRVMSEHINGWSSITILLCSLQDTHEGKGLVYKTVTKLNYWRQSCIIVWTQRLILLPIVAELTNPCCWIFVCWYMWTVISNQAARCSWGSRTRRPEKVAQGGSSLCVFPTQCYYRDDEIKEDKMGGDVVNIGENTFTV